LCVATAEELEAIPGIGPISARSLVDWFSHESNRKVIEKLRVGGVRLESDRSAPQTGAALEGLTFVITGTLPTMSRDEAKRLIEQHGGKVTGTVSGNTDHLLAGDKAGSKLTKAEQLGITILDEDALLALVNGATG
jgi:DNA ligase (NAD+)